MKWKTWRHRSLAESLDLVYEVLGDTICPRPTITVQQPRSAAELVLAIEPFKRKQLITLPFSPMLKNFIKQRSEELQSTTKNKPLSERGNFFDPLDIPGRAKARTFTLWVKFPPFPQFLPLFRYWQLATLMVRRNNEKEYSRSEFLCLICNYLYFNHLGVLNPIFMVWYITHYIKGIQAIII